MSVTLVDTDDHVLSGSGTVWVRLPPVFYTGTLTDLTVKLWIEADEIGTLYSDLWGDGSYDLIGVGVLQDFQTQVGTGDGALCVLSATGTPIASGTAPYVGSYKATGGDSMTGIDREAGQDSIAWSLRVGNTWSGNTVTVKRVEVIFDGVTEYEPITFTMPDILNMSEVAAKAALDLAGFDSPGLTIYGYPAVSTGGFPYDDADHLGETDDLTYAYAPIVGSDGTISLISGVAPGVTVSILEDGLLWWWDAESESYYTADYLAYDVWGVDEDAIVDGITYTDWATSPETLVYDGEVGEPFPIGPPLSSFRVEITSLHTPDDEAELLYTLTEIEDLSVKIGQNDARMAEVTISMWDPALETNPLVDFAHYLRIYYREQPQPVIWGPLRTEDDFDGSGKVKIIALDALRLQRHFVRLGDDALNDGETGVLTVDSRGVALLLDAAQNTTPQNTRDVPKLGMAMGTESTDSDIEIEVQRGQNVWDSILGIASSADGPDFELAPVDNIAGRYATLNTYDRQGTDRSLDADPEDGIVFAFNWPDLPDNTSSARARRLLPITHAHALDDNRKHRRTAAHAASSAAIGVYVEWIQTNFNVRNDEDDALLAIATGYIRAYGIPPHAVEFDLRPDFAQEWFYNEDFFIGDVVSGRAQKGYRSINADNLRIGSVELTQAGKRGPALTKLTMFPFFEADEDDDEDS